MSRLVVLGDPHGALEATRAVLEKEMDGRTLAGCVGDVVGYADGPSSSALAEFLRDQQVPTVEGNHEAWVGPDGSLSIVEGRVSSRQLTPATLEWIRSLPSTIEFGRAAQTAPLAVMVHSIREPRWDWIDASNAGGLVDRLGRPRVVVSGHSHRPRFIVVTAGGGSRVEPFDFEADAEISIDLPAVGSVLVDSGSLGRAERDPAIPGGRRTTGRARYGTYAIVDFERQVAILRRHGHG
ncbi:MAG: metallophosphoesterase family protein [Acidobacteria bacterium]|nr:metallophosphoesterase family protein [Acidobacteriota bacterium]